jgi:hypothetical protein
MADRADLRSEARAAHPYSAAQPAASFQLDLKRTNQALTVPSGRLTNQVDGH